MWGCARMCRGQAWVCCSLGCHTHWFLDMVCSLSWSSQSRLGWLRESFRDLSVCASPVLGQKVALPHWTFFFFFLKIGFWNKTQIILPTGLSSPAPVLYHFLPVPRAYSSSTLHSSPPVLTVSAPDIHLTRCLQSSSA